MLTPGDHDERDEGDLQAPAELVSALKQLPQNRPFVPPTVDEAVFRAAQRHLGRPRGLLFLRFPFVPWLAASAALLTFILLAPSLFPSRSLSTGWHLRNPFELRATRSAVPGPDIDARPAPETEAVIEQRQGDILDALRLAKRLQSGPVRDLRWDANGDGVVDARDVQAIAIQIVRLNKGGGS